MATAERLWLRAQEYIASNQIAAARIVLESLVQKDPQRVAARMLLASVYLSEGRVRAAAEHATAASKFLPNDAEAVSTAAHCLLRIGEAVAARNCLHNFDPTPVTDGRKLTALAHAFQMLGEQTTALAIMDRAQALGFDNPDFRYFHGLQLQFNGRVEDARQEMEACLRSGPTFGRASLTLARMRKQTSDSNHLEYIRRQLRSVERGSEDHAAFEFALFKELGDLGQHDEAFAALERGNAIMYARQKHDVAREAALFDAIVELTTPEFVQGHGADVEGPMPIFIIGLPRSGTTLMDRILDNHPQVISTGERTDYPHQLRWTADRHGKELIDESLLERMRDLDYAEVGRRYLAQTQWRAQGHAFYVDKLPANYMLAGFIHRALPQAPILHMVREPMDVCYSNYKALFGDSYAYSYELKALAAHYNQYRRLMRHWHTIMPGRIFDVNYTGLVTNPDASVSEILAHCGLHDHPACVDIAGNTTAVNTLSSAQVREPIHRRSLGEWQLYRDKLKPLVDALNQ